MKIHNHYNPQTHCGVLPVRVLSYNIIDWLEKLSPQFYIELSHEILYNGLNGGIKYVVNLNPIQKVAYIEKIDNKSEIYIHENFNQFLWCCCYSFLVVFDEAIQKRAVNGSYDGTIDVRNPIIKRALDCFEAGISLFTHFESDRYYQIPNPEIYNDYECCYIEKANGIYVASMVFILAHEIGHQYYGHLDYDPDDLTSINEELLADDYAFEKMLSGVSNQQRPTLMLGIIVGLGSLIFFNKSLSGGPYHPDGDDRIVRQIHKMSLDPTDNLWGIASLILSLWASKCQLDLQSLVSG